MIASGAYFGALQANGDSPRFAAAQSEWGDDLNHFIVTAGAENTSLPSGAKGRTDAVRLAKELSGVDGVTSATPLGGGLVAVATSRPEADIRDMPGVGTTTPDLLVQPAALADGLPRELAYQDPEEVSPHANDLHMIHAPKVWPQSTGSGVVVAVVDTGVLLEHPDLYSRIWRNPGEICGNDFDDDGNGYVDDCAGWDMGDDDADPRPNNLVKLGGTSWMPQVVRDHGSAIAGVVAGEADAGSDAVIGVAPRASIMPVKVSSGLKMPFSAIVAGTMYAIDNGADVVTASYTLPQDAPASAAQVLNAVAGYAKAHDVLIVAAAGNDNLDLDSVQVLPAALSASFDNVISVGGWLNQSSSEIDFANYGQSVDIVAPGSAFSATGVRYASARFEGTSFSAAYVAGGAALALSRDPSLTPAAMKNFFKSSATPMNQLERLTSTGMLNVSGLFDDGLSQLKASWRGIESVEADESFTFDVETTLLDADIAQLQDAQLRLYAVGTVYYRAYVAEGVRLAVDFGGRSYEVVTDVNGEAVLDADLTQGGFDDLLATADMRLSGSFPEGQYGLMLQVTDSSGQALTNGVAQYIWAAGPNDPRPDFEKFSLPDLDITFPDLPPAQDPSDEVPVGVPSSHVSSTVPNSGNQGGPSSGAGNGSSGNSNGNPGPIPQSPNAPSPDSPAGADSGPGVTVAPHVPVTNVVTAVPPQPAHPVQPGQSAPPAPTTTVTSGQDSDVVANPGSPSSGDGDEASSGNKPAVPHVPIPSTSTSMIVVKPKLPVQSGEWKITGVTPSSGLLTGGTLMKLTGVFPEFRQAKVLVGGQPASIVSRSSTAITAITPALSAGAAAVTLITPEGESLLIENGFTYVPSQQTSSSTTTTRVKTTTTLPSTSLPHNPIWWEDPATGEIGQQDPTTGEVIVGDEMDPTRVIRGALTLRKQSPNSVFTYQSYGRYVAAGRCFDGVCPAISIPK
jgi:serine protease